MLRRALIALTLATALAACGKKDACKGVGPSLEVDLVLGAAIARDAIHSLDVTVTAGSFHAQQTFGVADQLADGSTSFVVNVGEAGAGGFTADLTVTARDKDQQIILVTRRSVTATGDGCNFVEVPLGCIGPDGTDHGQLAVPEAGCWDISGQFTAADQTEDPAQLTIFGKTAVAGTASQNRVYALLAGAADPIPGSYRYNNCYGTTSVQAARGWSITRTPASANEFTIKVQGNSRIDCDASGKSIFSPLSQGELRLNRGWVIKDFSGCTTAVQCTAVKGGTVLTWRADSHCTGCCFCPEGAKLDLSVEVVAGPL
jgi:hypothetical protein